MIDFRYHLVSVIAIFLALALGIVVGTTTLNGGIVDTLRSSNKQVISDKRALESSVQDLRTQVSRRDELASVIGARGVSGQLTGQRVLMVTAPGASTDQVQAFAQLVTQAGGEPGGVVRLRDDLLDPTKGQVLDDLIASVAPAGLSLPEGTPTDRAAVLLAAALVHRAGSAALPDSAVAKIVGGFTAANLIDVQGGGGGAKPATLAVLLADSGSSKPLDDAGQQRERSELVMARALDSRSAGLVVAGPLSAADVGGLVKAVRDDNGLSDAVSTVDSADTPSGRLVVVLALAEQASGASGSYGEGPGAQAGAPAAARP